MLSITRDRDSTRPVGLWPFGDTFFDRFLTPERVVMPRVEVLQKDGDLVIRAEMPGIKEDDIEVVVTEDALTLRASRESEEKDEGAGYYRCERHYGALERTLPFPADVDTAQAKATLKDGLLEIRLPLRENSEMSKGRKITVQTG